MLDKAAETAAAAADVAAKKAAEAADVASKKVAESGVTDQISASGVSGGLSGFFDTASALSKQALTAGADLQARSAELAAKALEAKAAADAKAAAEAEADARMAAQVLAAEQATVAAEASAPADARLLGGRLRGYGDSWGAAAR